jgi:integrase
MTHVGNPLDTASGAWKWPLDLSAYDRAPALTAEEATIIAQLVTNLAHDRWQQQLQAVLPRLLQPLLDVLTRMALRPELHRRVVRAFLLAMQRTETTFWAWSVEDWLTLIPTCDALWRYTVVAAAYLLCQITDLRVLRYPSHRIAFARKIFGDPPIEVACDEVVATVRTWGYAASKYHAVTIAVCEAFLLARQPHLTAITDSIIATLYQTPRSQQDQEALSLLSRVLRARGIVTHTVSAVPTKRTIPHPHQETHDAEDITTDGIAPEWVSWCQRWYHHSTRSDGIRRYYYLTALRAGRWLAEEHPSISSPAHWTADIAAAYVAAIDRSKVGDWSVTPQVRRFVTWGKPLQPRTKAGCYAAMRAFFRDCQTWEWIPQRFDPGRCLRTPRTVRNLIGPAPRVIDTANWAKLVDAAMHLEAADIPRVAGTTPPYPLEMLRALAAVWCGAALRTSDIVRLRVGCVRWYHDDVPLPGSNEILAKDAVGLLEVPANKTSTTYIKPISPLVGQRIREWEQLRPLQPATVDPKTNETVHFLFSYRGIRLSRFYINNTLIPLLTRKAGVPEADARGRITSHRARATLATLLFTAKHPLSIFQLQAFLGHRSLESTQHYAQVTPTTLAKAIVDSGVHETLAYAAKVLIDQDAVLSGAAANGQPWKYYDLGHGYCTNAFFTTCPHRMACVRCDWYLPKRQSAAQYLESKANLARLKEEIPLTEEERAIVDGDLKQLEALCERLIDVPTLERTTPRELAQRSANLPIIPLIATATET